MVTLWNEWLAQRFIWDKGKGYSGGRAISEGDSWFVDVFSQEFNRDMALMKLFCMCGLAGNGFRVAAAVRRWASAVAAAFPRPHGRGF